MYFSEYASPIGRITIASDGDALTGLWFEGQKHFGAGILEHAVMSPSLLIFEPVIYWLDAYFSGKAPAPNSLKLHPQGSEFQRQV